MKTIAPSRSLKHALLADAIVSGGVAVRQLAAAPILGPWLRLPPLTLTGTGAFLAAYTTLLIVLATRRRLWPWLITLVVLGNMLWAVRCVGLLLTGILSPNALGGSYVLLQAVALLVFASREYRGLQRSPDASGDRVPVGMT